MVHQEKPQQMLRLFCCTIPFGTDSHFAQALVFVSRGLVAKNAPQEHFLNAPTDGAPKNALHESVGRFFIALFQEGTIWCSVGDTRTGRRHASAVRNATVRRSLARGRIPGNVAGVERRGDGERQGLEIKKVQVCKSVYGNNKFDGSLLRNF